MYAISEGIMTVGKVYALPRPVCQPVAVAAVQLAGGLPTQLDPSYLPRASQLDGMDALGLLEVLLELIEPFREELDSAELDTLAEIAARAADIRDSETVP